MERGARPEHAEERGCRDGRVGDRGDVVEPVTPANDKPRTVAERAPRVDVEAARLRRHRRQLRDRNRAEERVHAAEDPEQHHEPRITKRGGERTGEAQDADADGAAEGDCEPETKSQDSPERARGRGVCCHCYPAGAPSTGPRMPVRARGGKRGGDRAR